MLTVELVCVANSDTHLYRSTAPVQSLLKCLKSTGIHKNTVFAWTFHMSNKSGYVRYYVRIMKGGGLGILGVIAVPRQLVVKP